MSERSLVDEEPFYQILFDTGEAPLRIYSKRGFFCMSIILNKAVVVTIMILLTCSSKLVERIKTIEYVGRSSLIVSLILERETN